MSENIDVHQLIDDLYSGAGTGKNGRDIGFKQYARLRALGFIPPLKKGSHKPMALKFLEDLPKNG